MIFLDKRQTKSFGMNTLPLVNIFVRTQKWTKANQTNTVYFHCKEVTYYATNSKKMNNL